MAIANACAVADYLIWLSAEHGDLVTNKKIQKLLYYMQGWYLAFEGDVMFDEPIEAWVHGPVVRTVWDKFKEHGFNPLPVPSVQPEVHENVREMASEVLQVYGGESAYQLEIRTHTEKPWVDARQGYGETDRCEVPVNVDTMRAFFKELATSGAI